MLSSAPSLICRSDSPSFALRTPCVRIATFERNALATASPAASSAEELILKPLDTRVRAWFRPICVEYRFAVALIAAMLVTTENDAMCSSLTLAPGIPAGLAGGHLPPQRSFVPGNRKADILL